MADDSKPRPKRVRDRAPQGADTSAMHPETSWTATMMELEAGRFPELGPITRALRYGDSPVPRPVRDFLAEYLTGERRRPPGRPQMGLYHKRLMTEVIDLCYKRELTLAEQKKKADKRLKGMPSDMAAESTAAELGMSIGSIRDALHRRNGWELE